MYRMSKMVRTHEKYRADAVAHREYTEMVERCFGDICDQLGCDINIIKTNPHMITLCASFPQGDVKVKLKPSFHGIEPYVSSPDRIDLDFRWVVDTFKKEFSGRAPLEALISLGKAKEITEWLVELPQ